MADITLSRPSAQTRQVVSSAADDRFVFDFPTGDATLSRDGDNLIMTFDDGGALELTDFYTTYNKDNVPDFVVDGAEISGADFFTAMNEPDLMPAAGPASPQDQGSRHDADWTNSVLYGGIDSLGGLDLGFERAEEVVDDLSGLGMDGGNAPLSAESYGESILPAEPEPNVPGNSDDNQNHGVTVTPGVVTGAQHILYEKYLPEGTAAGEGELTVAGSLHIEAPDGVANISIGGVTVWANGELDSAVIDIPGGKLEVVNFDPATGQLDYEVQLTERLEHDGEEGEGERLHHDFTVTVTDTDGDSGSSVISVDITDDVPYGGSVRHDVIRGDVIKGNIFEPASDNPATAGADGLARVEWKLPEGWKWADGSTGPGSGTALREDYPDVSVNLEDDGSYTFTALGNLAGIGDSIAFDHIIHDSDGDWSEGKLDFNPSAKGDISPLPAELEVTVSEAALPDGSQNLPDADGKEIGVNATLKIPEGYKVVGGGAEGTYGKIVQNEDGSWSYQLTKQFDNSDAINDKMGQDTVTITLKDDQGNEYKVDVKVSILDDAPVMERIGAEEVSVEPGTETLFPEGKFDFTFGGHDKFTDYDNVALGMANENGWEVRWGDDWSKAPSAEHASGLHVSGWMYTYTEGNGQIILTPGENPLQVLYSDSQSKVDDKGKVDAGLQDGLTVGDPNPANDGSSSSLEIGAAPNGTTAEGLRFDLGDKIAHSVTVKLGAFFSAGSQNDAGYKYDPISERALLTFYDKNGNIVKQMEVQADSQDGQYTQSIDCYVAGGFSSFVVSALDNVKWAQEHDITYTGNADSDFVVQSVEFHKIIGTATGTVEVMSGADGLHASMNGYAALFDLEAMQGVIQDAFDGKATLEPDGEAGFLVKAGDTILFAAEIDQKGTWTLTQFESFEKPINLKFYTQDGDGDKATTDVTVNPYHGEAQGAQLAAYGDAMDDDSDTFLFALGNDQEDADNDALFDDSGEELIFYDKSDYLVQGGSGIDFLLSGKDDNLHLNEILANTDTNEGPLVSGVEVLLKGDGIGMLTSLEELEDYGIKVDGDRLMLGEGWKLDGEHYTYKEDSLILETTLTDPVVEDGTIVFENPSQTDELFTDALGISTVDDATEEVLRVAINNMQADIGGC